MKPVEAVLNISYDSHPMETQAKFKQGFSWLVVYTLAAKESHRFMAVWVQAVLGPAISTLLFLLIFAVVLEQRNPGADDGSYLAFLAPGLIMLTVLQNAFANASTSLLISKVNGTIFDILTAPIRPAELVLGYALGGVVRGLAVGLVLALVLAPFDLLCVEHLERVGFFGFESAKARVDQWVNEHLRFDTGRWDDCVDANAWIGQMIKDQTFRVKNPVRKHKQKSWKDKLKAHTAKRGRGNSMLA